MLMYKENVLLDKDNPRIMYLGPLIYRLANECESIDLFEHLHK